MIANGQETRWLFREPGNHALLPGRDIKSMVPASPPCSTFAGGGSGFSKPQGGSRKPALTSAETQEIQEHCFNEFSAVLLKNCNLSTPLSFLHLMSAEGLLGSWVVFVFRNVSVESATRRKEEKNIQKIDCFLLFPKIQRKQNSPHASGWEKATVHLRTAKFI